MTAQSVRQEVAAQAVALIADALPAFEQLLSEAVSTLRQRVSVAGKVSASVLDTEQRAAHGLAWLATYVTAFREMQAYGARLGTEGRYGEIEDLALKIGAGEFAAQVLGGIPMNQGEMVRLSDLGLSVRTQSASRTPAVELLIAEGNTAANRARLAELVAQGAGLSSIGDPGLDETLEAIRSEMRRFSAAQVEPHAHEWHLKNEYIPLSVIESMAELGVFGLTIPEEFGGLGLSKVAMCVVSEELSRGYIGVGSLGTRSEIAAELILCGGTPEQKAHWLPKIASGEVLPTAVFTEPNTGSDLASLRTRATREGDVWSVSGN
ncbi:MAG: acyl-CoA dehydrogenase family protein, partial [Bosea sp. (in: a-proteobacteria)]